MTPKDCLDLGARYPYDAPDNWQESDEADVDELPPLPQGWQYSAARGVIMDLRDRRGIKHGFDNVDEETRAEIVRTLAVIIAEAAGERAR